MDDYRATSGRTGPEDLSGLAGLFSGAVLATVLIVFGLAAGHTQAGPDIVAADRPARPPTDLIPYGLLVA